MSHFDSNYIPQLGQQARQAAKVMRNLSDTQKSAALHHLADLLLQNKAHLISENQKDLNEGKKNNLSAALLDRLSLNEKTIQNMVSGLQQIASMPDPVGRISQSYLRPNGMRIAKMQVPIGVIAIIYESRPNVTIDAAALCIKSGNACILRGGSEAFHSNMALSQLISDSLDLAQLPRTAVQVVNTTDRQAVGQLIRLKEYIDVLIPRGGKSLNQRLAQEASVPTIMHLEGNCHMYIDEYAQTEMAIKLAFHAKTYRYGICGALETLLVHKNKANTVLPTLATQFADKQVSIKACEQALAWIPTATLASSQDWETEYLAPMIAIKVVDSIDEAIEHIAQYSSGHTEAIITDYLPHAERFQREVDSSSVYVNLPTVFADGLEYGLGAEIGISTNRLHARGPVGLEGLTCYKWILNGQGQIRQ